MVEVWCSFFFFNDTATTEIYTLSLHDALPIWLLLPLHRGDPPRDRGGGSAAVQVVRRSCISPGHPGGLAVRVHGSPVSLGTGADGGGGAARRTAPPGWQSCPRRLGPRSPGPPPAHSPRGRPLVLGPP